MANRWICLSDNEINWLRDFIRDSTSGIGITGPWRSILRKFDREQNKIKVSSAKGKGRELQKWVCGRIASILNLPYDQQDDNCLIHSREMGQRGTDVVLRGEALKRFPFSIECKSGQNISLIPAIKQAKDNQAAGTEWMVVIRTKALPETIVCMGWKTLEKLYSGHDRAAKLLE